MAAGELRCGAAGGRISRTAISAAAPLAGRGSEKTKSKPAQRRDEVVDESRSDRAVLVLEGGELRGGAAGGRCSRRAISAAARFADKQACLSAKRKCGKVYYGMSER